MKIFSPLVCVSLSVFFKKLSPAACCVLTSPQMTMCSCSFNPPPLLAPAPPPPPPSPLSSSLTKILRHHVQKPKVPRPSSVSFPRPQVAHSIDTRHPLSPQHPWPLSPPPAPPPPIHQSTNLFENRPSALSGSAPSLLNPTSNAPFPLHRPSALPSSSPVLPVPPLSPPSPSLPSRPTLASISPSR